MIRAQVVNAPAVQAAITARLVRVAALSPQIESEGAVLVAEAAKRVAPVDRGELQGSISASGSEARAEAGHSGYQEYGTSRHAAQSFMEPGRAAAEPQYYQLASRLISAALI